MINTYKVQLIKKKIDNKMIDDAALKSNPCSTNVSFTLLLVNVPILHLLEREYKRGYEMGTLERNGLISMLYSILQSVIEDWKGLTLSALRLLFALQINGLFFIC